MEDILTSGDLTEGHSHLPVGKGIQLRNINKNISKMSQAHHTGQNVLHFKFIKVRFLMVAVTLRMKPRSNMWYVLKGIVKESYLIYKHRSICVNPLPYGHFYSPLVYIG